MKRANLKGHKSGRLTVIEYAGSKLSGSRTKAFWRCACECGGEAEVEASRLAACLTQSCGCLKKESIGSVNYKHGEANKTKENRTWQHMLARCYTTSDHKFPQYGGRGIAVCQRWRDSYEDFLSDMGRAPSPQHSIDRIDVNGHYEPNNCRWATAKEQGNNMTTNVLMALNGEEKNLRQWSEALGYNYKTFHKMLRYQGKTLAELAEAKGYKPPLENG